MWRELPFAESINSFRARQWIENGQCNGLGVINRAIKLLKANRSMLGKKSGFGGMMDCYIRFITDWTFVPRSCLPKAPSQVQ